MVIAAVAACQMARLGICLPISFSPNDSANSKDVHMPEDIQVMLDKYFEGLWMMFFTNNYTAEWINVEIVIAMGCRITPILFIMALEVVLKAAEGNAGPANLVSGCYKSSGSIHGSYHSYLLKQN